MAGAAVLGGLMHGDSSMEAMARTCGLLPLVAFSFPANSFYVRNQKERESKVESCGESPSIKSTFLMGILRSVHSHRVMGNDQTGHCTSSECG